MLKLDSIAVNTELEQAGQYIDIPDWEGVKLGVRSLEIPEYKIAFEQAAEKLARKYSGATVPPEERSAVSGKLLAKYILFDWQGISPAYSPEVAEEFLSSSRGRELMKKIVWAATRVARVEAEFEAAAVKN